MLIFRNGIWREHIPWFIGTVGMTLAAGIWYAVEACRTGEFPGGSSLPGFVFGVIGGLIMIFESLIGVRKMFRSVRFVPFRSKVWLKALVWLVLFSVPLLLASSGFLKSSAALGGILIVCFLLQLGAKHWMKAHIWLGLFSVPLLFFHAGPHVWNLTMSGVLMAIFLVVTVSGLWGLVLQQKLPTMMLNEIPADQIYSQIDWKLEQYLGDARQLVESACGPGALPPPGAAFLQQFFTLYVNPFFKTKKVDGLQLYSSERSAALFRDLKARLGPTGDDVVAALDDLCSRRRQLAKQSRLHNWLHGWLCVHLPLSVALLILLVFHVYFALKYF